MIQSRRGGGLPVLILFAASIVAGARAFPYTHIASTDPTGLPDSAQNREPICAAAAAVNTFWNWSWVAPFNAPTHPLLGHTDRNDFAVNWLADENSGLQGMANHIYGRKVNNNRTPSPFDADARGSMVAGIEYFAKKNGQAYNRNNYPNGLSVERIIGNAKVKYSDIKTLVTNRTPNALLNVKWYKADGTKCMGGRCNAPSPHNLFCAANADCRGGCSNDATRLCRVAADCVNPGTCTNPPPPNCNDITELYHSLTITGLDDASKKIAISNPWGKPGRCSIAAFTACDADAQCPAGRCSNDATRQCRVNPDCVNPGTCTNPAPQTCRPVSSGRCNVTATTLCDLDTQCPAGRCSNDATRQCRTNTDCVNPGTCTNPAPETCSTRYDSYDLDAAVIAATDGITIDGAVAGNAAFVDSFDTSSQACTTIRAEDVVLVKRGASPAVTCTVVDHPGSQTLTYTVHNPDSADPIYHVYLLLDPATIDITQARLAASSWLASHQPSWQVEELDPDTGPEAVLFNVTDVNDPQQTPEYDLENWTCGARGLHYSTASAPVGLGGQLTLGFDMPGLRNPNYWDDIYIVTNQGRDHAWSGTTIGVVVLVPALATWGILALVLLLGGMLLVSVRAKRAQHLAS